MARPPTGLASDPATGKPWQQRWIERLESLGNLPAKYIRAARDPARDPTWRPQSLSGQSDPALEGRQSDDALLAGLGKIAVPVLCAGAGSLGRYGDTVERLVRSRGVAERNGSSLPEVQGLLGPWVHAFPHLSPVGPAVDWIGLVTRFAQRHTGSGTPPPTESSLTYFETADIPVGPNLPMRWPGQYKTVSAAQLAAAAAPDAGSAVALTATRDGALVPSGAAPAVEAAEAAEAERLLGTVPDGEIVGQMGGEWFSWGVGSDLAADQSADDRKSLCFDLPPASAGVTAIRGNPSVRVVLADAAARRALAARSSGTDCLVARLCVVDASSGASKLAALGAASITLCEAVADFRPSARHDAPPLAQLDLDLHVTALTLGEGQTLRLALSSSYFPLFLAAGGHGSSAVASVTLKLPDVGGERVEPPVPELTSHPATLQRLRAPRHQRTALPSSAASAAGRGGAPAHGVHVLQDDGTVRMEDGLAVSTRSDAYVSVRSGRRVCMGTTVTATLTKGAEFARLEVKTSLEAGAGDDPRDAVAISVIEATACGAPLWSKTFKTPVTI